MIIEIFIVNALGIKFDIIIIEVLDPKLQCLLTVKEDLS